MGFSLTSPSLIHKFQRALIKVLPSPSRYLSSTTTISSPPPPSFLPSASVPQNASRPRYFDYQSTTPVDPRVLDKMLPLYMDVFGNPHSKSHAYGWEAEELVEKARGFVADLIGCSNKKAIVFTSGATESNNMAIKGAAGHYGKVLKESSSGSNSCRGSRSDKYKYGHIITTQIEHKCVLASCRSLQQEHGWDVTYLPVKRDGIIDLEQLNDAIREDTLLVSIMHVNNEIGVIQPIDDIGHICKDNKLNKRVLFHTDAAQSAGKVEIDVEKSKIDLLSLSGHKLYGPKGVGVLYVRNRPGRVRLSPIIEGGGQERGFRSGTLPSPLVVGLGEACRLGKVEGDSDRRHAKRLYNRLYEGIAEGLEDVVLNGSGENRWYGNLNISFSCVEGESLMMSINSIAASSGSACTSESLEPSYVLRAIGVNEEQAHTSIRFGIGRFTTDEDVDLCIDTVCTQVNKLRAMSPLWDAKEVEKTAGETAKIVWT